MPFNMEINQAFIAAVLTVIGYSLNDTVVVFDRIREYFGEHKNWELDKNINSALNSTLSRTLNTSLPPIFEECAIEVFRFRSSDILGFVKITILDFYDRRRTANTTLGTIKHEVGKQSSINLDTKNS